MQWIFSYMMVIFDRLDVSSLGICQTVCRQSQNYLFRLRWLIMRSNNMKFKEVRSKKLLHTINTKLLEKITEKLKIKVQYLTELWQYSVLKPVWKESLNRTLSLERSLLLPLGSRQTHPVWKDHLILSSRLVFLDRFHYTPDAAFSVEWHDRI